MVLRHAVTNVDGLEAIGNRRFVFVGPYGRGSIDGLSDSQGGRFVLTVVGKTHRF